MPNFDGRGPQGFGPGTGRGLGPCGAGMARGFRGGAGNRGQRCWRFPFLGRRRWTQEEEKDMLKQKEEALKQELEEVRKEKQELEKESA